MQSNPFSLIEEVQLMIGLLLKKMESLKTTRKKQQKFLITTIKILQKPLLESDPPQSAILIPNVKIELQL